MFSIVELKEYAAGFGNLSSEHWLGLEAMHALTSNKYMGRRILRIEFKDHNGKEYWIQYRHFKVSDRGDDYRLYVNTMAGGTAGDYLRYQSCILSLHFINVLLTFKQSTQQHGFHHQ